MPDTDDGITKETNEDDLLIKFLDNVNRNTIYEEDIVTSDSSKEYAYNIFSNDDNENIENFEDASLIEEDFPF